jgi:hypothetical protein
MNWKVPKDMVDQEERIRELEQEIERLREAAEDAVTQIFLSSDGRTLDHHDRKNLLDAGEKLQDALDSGSDGDEPEDIKGIVGFHNGEYHLTNAEMNPVCSGSDLTVQHWRWAKMYDPGRSDHDHDEIRNRLTCEECKAMQLSAVDGRGGDIS